MPWVEQPPSSPSSSRLRSSPDGGGSDSHGVTLNFWSYNEPGGSFRDAAARCTKQSEGRYRIAFHALANDADTQRQALVRRLAAKDSSIDIMSMDVVWTPEFAQAGWIKAWPKQWADKVKEGTLQGPLQTATYEGKLYGAPANSNTQLLWYRKDLVKDPPQTWDDLISTAEKMPKAGKIAIQGAQYEGATVWFNALEESAGGHILDGPDTVGLPEGPTKQALGIIARLGKSSAAPPTLSSMKEDPARLYFESGAAAFEINYPYIYASAKDSAPDLVKDIGWAPYPGVKDGDRGRQGADRRLQLGHRRLHEASQGGLRRRHLHARRGEPAGSSPARAVCPRRCPSSTTTPSSRSSTRSAS